MIAVWYIADVLLIYTYTLFSSFPFFLKITFHYTNYSPVYFILKYISWISLLLSRYSYTL